MEAIERMSYEFCEYQAKEGVIYAEARYCPFLLIPNIFNQANFLSQGACHETQSVSAKEIVEAVNKGFQRGETDHGYIIMV